MKWFLPLFFLIPGLTAAAQQTPKPRASAQQTAKPRPAAQQTAKPRAANLDESKVPPYEEPDPLRTKDGQTIASVNAWETIQRPHIYQQFEDLVYGRMPARTVPVSYTTESIDSGALDGLAIKKVVTITFAAASSSVATPAHAPAPSTTGTITHGASSAPPPAADSSGRLHLVIYLPRQISGPVPVFVGYSFDPIDSVKESIQWPLKMILSRGFGLVSAWYWDIEPDKTTGYLTGIRTRLAKALDIRPSEWSAIGAWAWGLERIGDYLRTDKAVDPKRLVVFGHSRLGKAALWAGASDQRFAMVISNESGEGGAALSKRDYGETIAIITHNFPHWFLPSYKQYAGNAAALPLDQFMLLDLMAPRPLYVASAIDDQWSDPRGEFLSAQLTGPVYNLYKEKGVGPSLQPPVDHPVGDFVRYHIRTGKHDITPYDWSQYLDFADQHLPRLMHRKPATLQ
jgi:hypothetical protein